MHSDNYIKRYALMPFLETMKRTYGVLNYFWRAESQNNGNIHFHIILDKQIHWTDIRAEWNSIMLKLGYIDAYRKRQLAFHRLGFKARPELFKHWPKDKQRAAYDQGIQSNWSNPNTTDIHRLKAMRNPAGYIIKEVTKDEKYRRIRGRIHGCSDGLKRLESLKFTLDQQLQEIVLDAMNDPSTKYQESETHLIILCNTKDILAKYSNHYYNIYTKYLLSQYNTLYKTQHHKQSNSYVPRSQINLFLRVPTASA